MLFYISTSNLLEEKYSALCLPAPRLSRITIRQGLPSSRPWSIEFFPVHIRVVAGDWPVITGCIRWKWCRLAASNQSSTRCRASLYQCQESWKVEALPNPRQECLWSEPWPLPPPPWRHIVSEDTPPVGLTNFMRRFLCEFDPAMALLSKFSLQRIILRHLVSTYSIKHETTSSNPHHVKTQPQRPCLLLRSKANLQSFLDSWWTRIATILQLSMRANVKTPLSHT